MIQCDEQQESVDHGLGLSRLCYNQCRQSQTGVSRSISIREQSFDTYRTFER